MSISAIDSDTVEVVITGGLNRIKGTSAEAKIIDILEHSLTSSGWPAVLDEKSPSMPISARKIKIRQLSMSKNQPWFWVAQEVLKVAIPDKYPDFTRNTVLRG